MGLFVTQGVGAEIDTDVEGGKHIPRHRDVDRAALIAALAVVDGHIAALLAKVIAEPATAAKQDALKGSVDALLAAIRPPQNHFAVVPGGGALANATRRIVCSAAGVLTVEANGVAVSYNVGAGQVLDIVAQKITAAPAGTVGQY